MGYWQAKVLPKIKQIFEKNPKKAAAAEACKTFDEAKEQYGKEFEEKKTELQPKVVEIYEAAAVEIKTLVKKPKGAGLKKHSAEVQKFLDELVKIEFPGSKAVSEASSTFGPSYVSGPILYVFEKVSTFIVVTEANKKEEAPAADVAPADVEETAKSAEGETTSEVEMEEEEIVVEAKKEEEHVASSADVAPAKVEGVPADVAPSKVEEAPKA